MPIFCLKSLLKLLNLYKIGKSQNHLAHVIKLLELILILQ
jgi:hypothetical protein